VKGCGLEVQARHFFLGNFDSFCVRVDIEIRLNRQSLVGMRVGDQIHDHLATFQGASPPIRGDVTKHAMLDLVPFRGSGRGMANRSENQRDDQQ